MDKQVEGTPFRNIWQAMMSGVEVTDFRATGGLNEYKVTLISSYTITEEGKNLTVHFPKEMMIRLDTTACRIIFPDNCYSKPTGPWGEESGWLGKRGANTWIGWDEKQQHYIRNDALGPFSQTESAPADKSIDRWLNHKVKKRDN